MVPRLIQPVYQRRAGSRTFSHLTVTARAVIGEELSATYLFLLLRTASCSGCSDPHAIATIRRAIRTNAYDPQAFQVPIVHFPGTAFYLTYHSRISTKCPAIAAAAAAISGLTRCVRPPLPCRPSKLRLEVEAQRSPGCMMSGFIPRHIEQPATRQSKPASLNMASSPSSSACFFAVG